MGLSGPLFFPRCLRLFEAPESPKDGRTKGPREQRTREPGDQRGAREGPGGTREGPERDQRTKGPEERSGDSRTTGFEKGQNTAPAQEI